MSLLASYIFVGIGMTILAVATGVTFAEQGVLKLKRPLYRSTSLVARQVKEVQMSSPSQMAPQIQEKTVKKVSRKPLLSFLMGKKSRRPSGELIYKKRLGKLVQYMRINMERGVNFYTVHTQLKNIGWKDADILKAYSRIKR